MTSYRSLARNHDFTVLWVGQTISELGSRVSMFVFPLIAYALTGSTLVAAGAEAAHLLGMAATLLPAGVLADRFDRRRIMRVVRRHRRAALRLPGRGRPRRLAHRPPPALSSRC